MNKQEFYASLPNLIQRLFTWGILAAFVFLLVWYRGGLNIWGEILTPILRLFSGSASIAFNHGNTMTAQFFYTFSLEDGRQAQLGFPINQLNFTLVEVVTLLAFWPGKSWLFRLRLGLFCFIFTLFYHTIDVLLQLYSTRIGPAFANRHNLFWENTLYYQFIKNVSAFDKFILRFWGGFPIFLMALISEYFWSKSGDGEGSKSTTRAKPKSKK